MRKPLLLATLLTLLLLSATAVSAQSFSVFGGVGYGALSMTVDGQSMSPKVDGGLALQAGVMYDLLDNVGVGVMFDKVSSTARNGTAPDVDVSLSSYNVVTEVTFDLDGAPIDLGLVAGLGSYKVSSVFEGDNQTYTSDSVFGYLVGANVQYAFDNNWAATGTAMYRTATFADEGAVVGGWSVGAGIVYKF